MDQDLRPVNRWAGQFGTDYTKRNAVEWQQRIPFWKRACTLMALKAHARILEVGCNAGWNLMALAQATTKPELFGVDVNDEALEMASHQGIAKTAMIEARDVGSFCPGSFDLVFTAGVLIHVPPAELQQTMQSIIDASRRYVMCVEYETIGAEQEIEYRGERGLLWKRPYWELYHKAGLIPMWGEQNPPGFDRCYAWLFKKANT